MSRRGRAIVLNRRTHCAAEATSNAWRAAVQRTNTLLAPVSVLCRTQYSDSTIDNDRHRVSTALHCCAYSHTVIGIAKA